MSVGTPLSRGPSGAQGTRGRARFPGGSAGVQSTQSTKETSDDITDVKGDSQNVILFLLIISIIVGRLEATASADGDIGRSSQLDHSKELDLYFSELYWSSFLGFVQKTVTETK